MTSDDLNGRKLWVLESYSGLNYELRGIFSEHHLAVSWIYTDCPDAIPGENNSERDDGWTFRKPRNPVAGYLISPAYVNKEFQ